MWFRKFYPLAGVFSLLFLGAGCSESFVPPDDDPEPATPAPDWGAACPPTCEGGLACIQNSRFPGGYCSQVCDAEACGVGARCVTEFGVALCLADCSTSADCRDGYQCWRGSCRPLCEDESECGDDGAQCEATGQCSGAECATPSDCGPDQTCNDGRCITIDDDDAGMPPPTDDCTRNSDCDSDVCLDQKCASSCTDRGSCGDFDLACIPIAVDSNGDGANDAAPTVCVEGDPTGRFLAGACTTNANCESRSCIDGQCEEACDDDGDCVTGQICTSVTMPGTGGATFSGCDYPARSGDLDIYEVPLGEVDFAAGSVSSRINFATPRDAVSFAILMEQVSGDPNITMSVFNLYAPDDSHPFDVSQISMLIDQPIRWYPGGTESGASMLVPNSTTDRLTFRHGRYGLYVGGLAEDDEDTRSGRMRLTAQIKRSRTAVSDGTLNLNIFLVGVGLTATSARTDTRLQNALDEVGEILGQVGIAMGTINYVAVSSAAASQYAIIESAGEPDSDLEQMFALSEGRTENAVNVFLIREISEGAGESGGIALGIAGGIPGPTAHGSLHSGVAVAFDENVVGDDYRVVAQIMSHEVGHYLGLFHVTESSRACSSGEIPTEEDPCAPFGGTDPISDTTRGDGRNLMHWALGGNDGRTYNVELSDGQGFVITRNPLVE